MAAILTRYRGRGGGRFALKTNLLKPVVKVLAWLAEGLESVLSTYPEKKLALVLQLQS